MFVHTHRHLEHWQVQLQIQLRLHRHTAVRTLATQKMWQPIEHLAISGASHATSWCNGHHRADLRCCSDQAFRECKHQRAKPARGRAASTGCCFAPHLFLRAWRWRERHDGRPQRVPSRSLRQETSKLISVQPVLGFQSCRAWSSSNGCRFFVRARRWRGVLPGAPLRRRRRRHETRELTSHNVPKDISDVRCSA